MFTIIGYKCYFVYKPRNDSAPYHIFMENDRRLTLKLFDKIPTAPSFHAGKQLLKDIDDYNLSLGEYLHYVVYDRIRFLEVTRELAKSGGPLTLKRNINESVIREMYCFNETDMQELNEHLNLTRTTWDRFINVYI